MSFKVVGLGEVLWDLFPSGKKMGGAPANFAYHARALGADARVVSRVGNDAIGLSSECVSVDPTHPTGTVTVELMADGQPHYVIHEGVAWDHLVADATA